MSRLEQRIEQARALGIGKGYEYEVWAMQDVQRGFPPFLLRIPLKYWERYEIAYRDAMTIKALDEKERQDGSHQPELNPSVCVSAVR